MSDNNGQNPPFPSRFLRLLSMGCGISKFNPKEVVEASPHNNNPPHSNKNNNNCVAGESKPLIGEGGNNNFHSPDDQSRKDSSSSYNIAAEKMTINVKRGDTEEKHNGTAGTATERRNYRVKEDPNCTRPNSKLKETGEEEVNTEFEGGDDDHNLRAICRGGSPSFREYCVDFDPRSRSIQSEDYYDDVNACKWSNESTLNPEKGSETESQVTKKVRRGKSFMNALHRGKSGRVRNFLTGSRSRRQHPNCSSPPHHENPEKLLATAKAS